MKKLTAFLLIAALCLSLAACGKKNSSAFAAPVTDGSLTGAVQPFGEKTALTVKGLYLTTGSGQHPYPVPAAVEGSVFATARLNAEYELNEWIDVYAEADPKDAQIDVYVFPDDGKTDRTALTAAQAEELCRNAGCPALRAATPDPENYGFLGSLYVNPEGHAPGLYDLVFAMDGELSCLVQLSLVPASF